MVFKMTNRKAVCQAGRLHNEDACYICDKFAFVIDGATGLYKEKFTPAETDAQWLAQRTAKLLSEALCDNDKEIQDILIDVTDKIYKEYLEQAGREVGEDMHPSAALHILRVRHGKMEFFGLGDCLTMVEKIDGTIVMIGGHPFHQYLDDRTIDLMVEISQKNGISIREAFLSDEVVALLRENRSYKNKEDGYPIYDLTGRGLNKAKYASFDLDEIVSVAIMSDGFSEMFSVYGIYKTPEEFMKALKSKSLEELLLKQCDVQNTDMDFNRWPRFKHRDDSAAVFACVMRCDD